MARRRRQPAQAGKETIFPTTTIHALAVRWKDLNEKNRHTEAMALLDEIICLSTPMFERLATFEEYHVTVPLEDLVDAAQEKVIKWLLKWNPKRGGSIFSFFSKCAKNAFISQLVKRNQYNKRFVSGSDSIEKYAGQEDHASDKRDLAEEFRNDLSGLYCRWGSPQEQGALRYLIECVIDQDNHNKPGAIRGAAFAYGISLDMSKFFYSWVLFALRDVHYHRIRVPFTNEDLIRHAYSYTHFADLFQGVPSDSIMWMIATKGGTRIKIPTLSEVTKLIQDERLCQEIDRSDKDPDSICEIARKYGKTQRYAEDVFCERAELLDPNRSGEFNLYGDDDETNRV
jgi:hypothetical protein